MATASDVAQWMLTKVNEAGELYQEDTVYEIAEIFGDDFIYENENGNQAISRTVLREFRKISEDSVVWESAGSYWRKRAPDDNPGRKQ